MITTVRSRISSSTPTACSVTIGRRSKSSTSDPPNAMRVDAAVEKVRQGRNRADLEIELERSFEHSPHSRSRGIGHRDQKGPCSGLGSSTLHRRQATEYSFTGHDLAHQPRVVVKEPNRVEAGPGIAFSRPRNADARLSGAIQQGRLPVVVGHARESVGVMVGRPDREPPPANDGRAQEGFDDPERHRKPTRGIAADIDRPIEEKRARDRAEQDGNGDSLEVGDTRETPSAADTARGEYWRRSARPAAERSRRARPRPRPGP